MTVDDAHTTGDERSIEEPIGRRGWLRFAGLGAVVGLIGIGILIYARLDEGSETLLSEGNYEIALDGVPSASLVVEGSTLALSGECNTHSGPYSVESKMLKFRVEQVTAAACSEADAFMALLNLLQSEPSVLLDSTTVNEITFSGEDASHTAVATR